MKKFVKFRWSMVLFNSLAFAMFNLVGVISQPGNAADLAPVKGAHLASATQVAYPLDEFGGRRLHRKIYAGLGLGRSWTEPDTSEVDRVDPNDRVHLGGQIMLGMDLNKWLSLELHGADLGDAGLSPSGKIAYRQFGLSGLFYLGENRHRYNRQGFTGFGRTGLGYLSNKASRGVSYNKNNSIHLLLGLGMEYATRRGLALRGEFIFFDEDVNYSQVSLLYRFGKRQRRQREVFVEAPTVESTPVVAPIAAVAVAPAVLDSDSDGIVDSQDNCPTTRSNVAVDNVGCALFAGVIEGVNFHTSSAKLTDDSTAILNSVVATLLSYPQVTFELSAHTDSQGGAEANYRLSQDRAVSVADFLVSAGINRDRFEATAYGETQPIATNETAEGRRQNRRVEINASQ